LNKISQAEGKIIFLPNPNAPTGEFIDINVLKKYIQNSNKLWIIDEAYNDFVDKKKSSFIPFINEFSNVIVLRTFSKSYSLAGSRIGIAISSNKKVIESFYNLKDSYNEDVLNIHIGKIALEDNQYFQKKTKQIISQRKKLAKSLLKLKFKVISSEANFLFVQPPNEFSAKNTYEYLKKNNILVRYFSNNKTNNFIRITIGKKQQNKKLIKQLKAYFS